MGDTVWSLNWEITLFVEICSLSCYLCPTKCVLIHVKLISSCNWNSSLIMGGVINKLVPSGFQTPDSFSFKFSSLKKRILYVFYMYFCFYHFLGNLTSFVKFATHWAFQTEVPFFYHSILSPTITYQMSHQLWLQIMLFGEWHSPTATELYMLIFSELWSCLLAAGRISCLSLMSHQERFLQLHVYNFWWLCGSSLA